MNPLSLKLLDLLSSTVESHGPNPNSDLSPSSAADVTLARCLASVNLSFLVCEIDSKMSLHPTVPGIK